jgi:serine/threonine protein kinase
MDQDRWKIVNCIFHAALEISPGERDAFVVAASKGDPELHAEVELLLRADRDAGSYLDLPLVPVGLFSHQPLPLTPGDMLCGRFRILRAIGEGGMGHVFEALDSELAVHVALKVIRSEIATNPETLERFRQEVRLARRITHPNVCRTFDIERETRVVDPARGTKMDVVFLTMEFLQGETLASRIKETGALQLTEAYNIARQIAAALQAAHAMGIVHRDMKPTNIMLVPSQSLTDYGFRAVISDFGLARLGSVLSQGNSSSLTHTGRPIGTIPYMAPEQLEGVAVSSATDIYAFGLILFEMVTGVRAFSSDNFLSGITQRLNGPPPSARALVPDLPSSWSHAIEGCLHLKPVGRFQSAADVIAVLDGGRLNLPNVRNPSIVRRIIHASWSTRVRSFAPIFLATVSLILGGLRIYRSGEHSRVAPGALVYLTQVKNQTGEKTFDYLTELIQAGLAQSAQINVLAPGRIGDTLQQMNKPPDAAIDQPIAREIAMRTGAARVIFVDVTGSDGDYRINIDIQEPDNSPTRYREHWPKSFTWHASGSTTSTTIPPELLTAIRTSSNWIRFKVGEAANDIASLDTPPEDVTTGDWRALADYSHAEQLNRQLKKDDAIAALNSAVVFDPQFALAYARIGDIEFSLGRSEEGYRAYARSLASDFDRRLTRRELDRIRGIYASDSWDYAAAEAAFRDYTVFYPNDFLGWFYRALPLVHLGRFDEAIATLKNAERVAPGGIYAPYDLALCYAEVGDLASARHWIDVLRKRNDPEGAELLEGVLSFLAGNGEGAIRSFESLRASSAPNFRFLGHSLPARVFAEQRDYQNALNASLAAEAESKSQGNRARQAKSLLDQAYIQCILGLYSACLSTTQSALSLDNSPELLMNASDLFIRAIDLTSGSTKLQLRSALVALPGRIPEHTENVAYTIASLHLRAAVLASSGHLAQAIAEARREAAIDTQFRRRDMLARLLLRAAAQASDPMRQQALRTEARENYARSALHPTAIWLQPWLYAPGVWTQDFDAFLQAFPPADAARADTETAATLFHKIRLALSTPSGKSAVRTTSSTSKGGDQSQKENQE